MRPIYDMIQSLDDGSAMRALSIFARVKFERDKDGRVSLKIEKKPASEGLLKLLVEKLLAFMGGGRMPGP